MFYYSRFLVPLLLLFVFFLWLDLRSKKSSAPAPAKQNSQNPGLELTTMPLQSGDTLILRINSLVASRNFTLLEPLLRQYLQLHPNNGQGAALLGKTLAQLNKPAEALRWLELAKTWNAPDQDLDQWILAQRRLAAEEGELGLVRSAHFDLRSERGLSMQASDTILQALEQAYDQLCLFWNHYPANPIPVVLHSSTATLGENLPDWTGALFDGKVRIPANVLDEWPQHRAVLLHELSHAFVHDMTGRSLPTWLDEGLAQLLDGSTINRIALGAYLPSANELTGNFVAQSSPQVARALYQWSLGLVLLLMEPMEGRENMRELLRSVRSGENFPQALQKHFQTDLQSLIVRLQQKHGISN